MEEIDINFLFSKFLHVTVLERWTRLASLQSCRHYWSILFQSHLPSLVADWKNSYGAGIQTPKPHWSIKTPIRDSFLRSAPIQARRRPATLPDQLDTWVVWWLLSLQQQKRHKTSSGFVFTLNKQSADSKTSRKAWPESAACQWLVFSFSSVHFLFIQ